LEKTAEAALTDATVGLIDTNRLEVKDLREGSKARFFHSQSMTFAYYAVQAGAWIHDHSHANDEVSNVIDGQLEITIAGDMQVASPGCAAVVSQNTVHSVKALSNVRAIFVDYPRRDSIAGISL
jgi:quercetin dioxygenase-like cupin family protein